MRDSENYQFCAHLNRSEPNGPCDVNLVSGRRNHFVCDPRHWAGLFPGRLSARLVDLLRIATATYVVDRISPRDRTHNDYGWHRSLSMDIEVFDIDFWQRAETCDCLHRCIDFLSGDSWDIRFVRAPLSFDPGLLPFNPTWKPRSDKPIICLFSGGLDSAAGLVRRIRQRSDQGIIPVLVMHQSGQGRLVRNQMTLINFALGVRLEALILPFWMRSPEHLSKDEESQRSRSFLFCSAAAVLAALIEAQAIEMMEGGIGAINWPLMTGMVGSKATRSSHPTFLRRFSRLLQLVTDRDLQVDVPHRHLTKAELVGSLREAGLTEIATGTPSCVHYPLRDSQAKQCGTCPACIFRRQALLVAGIDEPVNSYKDDLFGRTDYDAPDENLRAFLMQVDKLSTLDHSDQPPRSLIRHLRATDVISDGRVPGMLLDLYRRYRKEWLLLAERGLKEGWKWSRMIATQTEQMETRYAFTA
jgi:7-cyano-7-deazaguanine synthase in queuosine biosynthesis